ncbi:MAG: SecY family transport protein, partial [bacterium]|nr:SecY family transport protein [bacterium]
LLISQNVIDRPPFFGLAVNVMAITAGSMIALWLGELVSEQKIGNGISMIILAGILSGLPGTIRSVLLAYTPSALPTYFGFIIVFALLVMGIVYLNEGERKVPIAYARRIRGNKMFGGSSSYLPLKVNQAGMIPLIFAISVLLFPQFIAQIAGLISSDLGTKINDLVNSVLNNQVIYGVIYFLLVFTFTFFYTAITFNPEEVSKNLQRSGGFIPGIRPGEATGAYFKHIINRVTLSGAIFLGLIAILPIIIQNLTGIAVLTISGTALLIVVAVVLDMIRQIDSQLTVRGYESIE